jgi:hypothetical protein
MIYLDYKWELFSFGIILDEELNTDEIGWKEGDCFRLEKVNGVSKLVKFNTNIIRIDNEI